MAYPLYKDSDIPFYIISFDTIVHRVNPIAPRYLPNEESVNEVSRVLLENLLELKESGSHGTRLTVIASPREVNTKLPR